MPQITEFFVLRLQDAPAAAEARRIARPAFLALPGVEGWRSYRSVAEDRPTLFVEAFTFADREAARAAGARFSEMAETAAFLGTVEEMLVGQHFIEVTQGDDT